MLAELTHRCPLQCPYCSNPVELLKANRELDTEPGSNCSGKPPIWAFSGASVRRRPTLRRDLDSDAGLSARRHTNLITAGIGIAGPHRAFADAGLDHLQLSFQGARPATAERIGNHGSHERSWNSTPRAFGRPAAHHQRADPPPQYRGSAGIHQTALSLDAERLKSPM
jgi:pyrroloquinoline quinone biosynthesis protein E